MWPLRRVFGTPNLGLQTLMVKPGKQGIPGLYLAGNEGTEKKMQTCIKGYVGFRVEDPLM